MQQVNLLRFVFNCPLKLYTLIYVTACGHITSKCIPKRNWRNEGLVQPNDRRLHTISLLLSTWWKLTYLKTQVFPCLPCCVFMCISMSVLVSRHKLIQPDLPLLVSLLLRVIDSSWNSNDKLVICRHSSLKRQKPYSILNHTEVDFKKKQKKTKVCKM